MRSWRRTWLWMATAVVSWGTPVAAQQDEGPKALVIEAVNLMAGDARHQELSDRGGDAAALYPGDVIHYRLVFTNITDVPVRKIVFNDPLPAGLRYVGESAASDRDDVVIDYSIDGGATYSAQPMIEEIVDGTRVRKPAPPDRYTHIRWRIEGWVQPGAQVTAEFRAKLPEANQAGQMPEAGRSQSTGERVNDARA